MKNNTCKTNYLEAFAQTDNFLEIKSLNKYIKKLGDKYYVHKKTGLVINKRKVSYKFTADQYSKLAFKSKFTKSTYSANIPAVISRLVYIATTLNNIKKLKNKSLIDIGAGTGEFLSIIKSYGAKVFGVEPKHQNCLKLKKKKIKFMEGCIEDLKSKKTYDFATVLWTLCNMYDPLNALLKIKSKLKKNGILVAAVSSRILVHPKKSLANWIGTMPKFLSPYHFSFNTLKSLLMLTGFKVIFINRYHDTDYLVIIATKSSKKFTKFPIDNYKKIRDFFSYWEKIDKKIKILNK